MRLVVTGAGGMLGQDVMRVAGAEAVGLARADLDVTDREAVGAAIGPDDLVINCAAWTDVDGAEAEADAAMLANRDGARHVAEAAGRVVHVSTDYVFDGSKRGAYVESDPTAPLQEYGRTKLAGEEAVAAANPDHLIVRASWLFGAGGANFVATMLRLGDERDELRVVDDQIGCPTFTGHLAEGLVALGAGRGREACATSPAGARARGIEFAREIFARAGVDCQVEPCTTAEFPRPAARPANSVMTTEYDGVRLPAVAGRARRLPGSSRMKLLVTGAAGFIGSTYVRLARQDHEVTVLDKLTYAGRRENLPDEVELVVGGIEDRELVMDLTEGVDAIVNFAAESHVDRSIADQDAFARTHVIGTSVLLDAARDRGVGRYLQVSTDEVYGSIPEGSFTETSPLDPSSPYSATKAGGDLLVSAHAHTYGIEALICRGSNNYGPRQYPEKLIPLCVLNALHGDSLPVYGDGRQVRNWLYVEDFARGIHAVLERGRPGRGLQRGRPGRVREHRRGAPHPGAHRPRRVADRVRARPPRARPPLLAQLGQDPRGARLGGRGPLPRGPGPHGRLVPRQRGLVGPDPLGRVPRVLRAPLRAGVGLSGADRTRRKATGS